MDGIADLVGRRRECTAIRELIARARDGAGEFLCLEGDPGIGKTALLEWGRLQADAFRVLHARASPDVDGLAYSAVARLLDPLRERGGPLTGANVAALNRLFDAGTEVPTAPEPALDPLTVGASLLAYLEELSQHAPLLVVIDDVHWLDVSSMLALAFVARRVEGLGLAMLVATRGELASCWPDDRACALTLSGLSDDDVATLFDGRAAPTIARQLAEAAHGNPLALNGIYDVLSEDQRWGRAAIQSLNGSSEPRRLFGSRLAGLDPDARIAVSVVAHDDHLDRRVVLAACTMLGADDAEAGVSDAERQGLLRPESSRLALVHPLLRSEVALFEEPGAVRAVHRAIADSLRRDADLERRAWHVSRSVVGPDEEAAGLLAAAANRALVRGDPSAAAMSFLRAGELTESAPDRIDRLGAAGDAFAVAGQSGQAMAAFDLALESTSDLRTRGALLLRRLIPIAEMQADPHLVAEMDEAITTIESADPALAASLAVYSALPAFASGSLSGAADFLRRARSLSSDLDPMTDLAANGLEAIVTLFHGDAESARPVLLALAAAPGIGEVPSFATYVANALSWADEYAAAGELVDSMIAMWRSRRAPGSFAYPLVVRSELQCRTGKFIEARADGEEGLLLAAAAGRSLMTSYGMCALARAEASLGQIARARSLALDAITYGGFVECLWGRSALGFVELTDESPGAAIVQLEKAAEYTRREDLRMLSPAPWAPDLVEAYVLTDRHVDARALVARMTEEAGPKPTVWTRGALARCAGLVEPDFAPHFRTALATQAQLPIPFETARTRLCFGERLERAGNLTAAATELRGAHDGFARLGAARWLQRAERGLAACGQPAMPSLPPALASLTAKEYQVAAMIASGASNREAATNLFLSTRTVETHLARVYRKLGINSRSQLVLEFSKGHP